MLIKLVKFSALLYLVSAKKGFEKKTYKQKDAACKKKIREQSKQKFWDDSMEKEIEQTEKTKMQIGLAKNIILFIGDGMNLDSVTGGRIEAGRGEAQTGQGCDAEHKLFIEKEFPYSGLSKTYCTDMQTPDSAATASAIYSGIKAPYVTLGHRGFNQAMSTTLMGTCKGLAQFGSDCANSNQTMATTNFNIVRLLKKVRGRKQFKVGIVSNTHMAHATPAASYAFSNHRLLYNRISKQLNAAIQEGIIDVVLSGGAKYADNFDTGKTAAGSVTMVKDSVGLKKFNKKLSANHKLVGLFTHEEMNWIDTREDKEPTLPEIADKAVKLLRNGNSNGFFLMVESGNIDRAHHKNYGLRSIREMAEFDETIEKVVSQLTPQEKKETLIIVTADHGHTFQIGGQNVKRGTDITSEPTVNGTTVAGYFTGPNSDNDNVQTAFDQRLRSYNQMNYASHSAEDVPIFARGPMAHLLTGVHEESYIGQVMKFATCVDHYAKWKNDPEKVKYASHCCTRADLQNRNSECAKNKKRNN